MSKGGEERHFLSEPLPPRRLSDDLRELLAHAGGRAMTLAEIESALKHRGFGILIMVLTLPFLLPVSIPGMSIPFGIVMGMMGCRLALGQKPWLPRFILQKEIQYPTIEKSVAFGLKACAKMERFARPRMHFLQRWPGMMNLIGVGIASGGLLLALPLPPFIPLSNTIPGISVFLLTAGMIERDGLLVLLGYLLNLVAWVYFTLMVFVSEKGIRFLFQYFG